MKCILLLDLIQYRSSSNGNGTIHLFFSSVEVLIVMGLEFFSISEPIINYFLLVTMSECGQTVDVSLATCQAFW